MLANVPVCATLPTSDLDRARRFYREALGLTEGPISVGGGVFFTAGSGTMLRIYERPPGYTPAEYTVIGFLVEDLEEEMRLHRDLRARELREEGAETEDARYAAQRKVGNTRRFREEIHQAGGWSWLDGRRPRRTPCVASSN